MTQDGKQRAHLSIDKADQATQTKQEGLGMDDILAGLQASFSESIGLITSKYDKKMRKKNPNQLVIDLQQLEELLQSQLHKLGLDIDKALD